MERFKVHVQQNAQICTFGVTEGKFLGYLVSPEGIKPHPEKTEAITNMRPPKNLKEVQRLNRKVAALADLYLKVLKNAVLSLKF